MRNIGIIISPRYQKGQKKRIWRDLDKFFTLQPEFDALYSVASDFNKEIADSYNLDHVIVESEGSILNDCNYILIFGAERVKILYSALTKFHGKILIFNQPNNK